MDPFVTYCYNIEFHSMKKHANADSLFSSPLLDNVPIGNSHDPVVFNISQLEALSIQIQQVVAATLIDPVLHKVLIALRT